MSNTLEKMRITLDKDLDVCYQVVGEAFEKVKVTTDKDFDKFMKTGEIFFKDEFEISNSSLVTF